MIVLNKKEYEVYPNDWETTITCGKINPTGLHCGSDFKINKKDLVCLRYMPDNIIKVATICHVCHQIVEVDLSIIPTNVMQTIVSSFIHQSKVVNLRQPETLKWTADILCGNEMYNNSCGSMLQIDENDIVRINFGKDDIYVITCSECGKTTDIPSSIIPVNIKNTCKRGYFKYDGTPGKASELKIGSDNPE